MRILGNEQNAKVLTLTAQGTGTVNGSDQVNAYGKGLVVYINISTITGTGPTLTVNVQAKDPTSGNYVTLLASAALGATGTTKLTIYPGAIAVANAVLNDVLPPNWRVQAVVAGTTPSVTATISAQMIT